MISGGVVEAFGSAHPRITMTGAAAVTAGQVVAYTANRTVGPAANGSAVAAGVALQSYDGTASTGSKFAVATGGVWYLTASGAIAFGQFVVCAAAGAVRAYVPGTDDASLIVGKATEAIANGAKGRVLVRF